MSPIFYSVTDSFRSRFAILRSKIHMKRVGLHRHVKFKLEGWVPKIVLDENYENYVVWGSRTVTVIGIITNLLLIPPPINIFIAVLLTALDVIFERTTLMVQSVFVQPLPEKWDSDSWQGNLYHYNRGVWCIGLLFDSDEIARVALETIRAWNYDEDIDHEGNVKMSFVEMNDGGYMTYIYPSSEREVIQKAAEKVEREQIEKGKIREHYQSTFSVVMAQDFDNPPGSYFQGFKRGYEGGRVMLNTFTTSYLKDRNSGPIAGIPDEFGGVDSVAPLSVKEVEIMKEDELEKLSVEYQHLKYIVPLLDD